MYTYTRPSEVLTVDLHRTGKASHVGFGKLNAFDTEPRNMKIPDFETWVRTEVRYN